MAINYPSFHFRKVGFSHATIQNNKALLNLNCIRRFKRPRSARKNTEKEKSTCFHKCLVEHRGVEPLTF